MEQKLRRSDGRWKCSRPLSLLIFLLTVWMIQLRSLVMPSPSTSIPSVDRRFSPYDCFARDGVREPWEPQVDGIIIQRGYQKYLVMWQDEAERRSGGAKFGQEIPVEEFERDKHVTTCPKGWHDEVDHKSIKRFSVRELAH